ncbi:MAG: hypothetical protein WBB07_17500 [Mycobacterium sp.]
MSELTPERIRDAAEVADAYGDLIGDGGIGGVLRREADRLEREQAAEAQREKRVEELAREVYNADPRNYGYPWDSHPYVHADYYEIARYLLRYPALAEQIREEQS